MILNYLQKYRNCTTPQIIKGTGCQLPTTREALQRLRKEGLITSAVDEHNYRTKIYNIVEDLPEGIMADTDVCGKHYMLSGEQMQALRDLAEKFDADNRRR